jgi:predicted Rossmann-fold nucleotide-binding protein
VSDAFVVTPGGIRTVLEAMMIWQLLQVRHLYDVPLVFVGPMWRELVAWATRVMLRPDMSIPQCVDTGDEAIAIIRARHAAWAAGR